MDKSWIFFLCDVDLRSEEDFIHTHTHTHTHIDIYTHIYIQCMCIFFFLSEYSLLQHKYFCHEFNKCNSSENKITVPVILDTEAHEWSLTEG